MFPSTSSGKTTNSPGVWTPANQPPKKTGKRRTFGLEDLVLAREAEHAGLDWNYTSCNRLYDILRKKKKHVQFICSFSFFSHSLHEDTGWSNVTLLYFTLHNSIQLHYTTLQDFLRVTRPLPSSVCTTETKQKRTLVI